MENEDKKKNEQKVVDTNKDERSGIKESAGSTQNRQKPTTEPPKDGQ